MLKIIENKTTEKITLERKNAYGVYVYLTYTKTRYGFKHECELRVNANNDYKSVYSKCIYYNRTWENYTFQSVILKAFNVLITTTKNKESKRLYKHLCDMIDNAIKSHKYKYEYTGL